MSVGLRACSQAIGRQTGTADLRVSRTSGSAAFGPTVQTGEIGLRIGRTCGSAALGPTIQTGEIGLRTGRTCGSAALGPTIQTGEVGLRVRELVREICRSHEIEILQGSISPDHVHVLLSCPPNLSPSKIMQYIKGKTSRKMMMEFKHIQKQFWGRHFWARGYFVSTVGRD